MKKILAVLILAVLNFPIVPINTAFACEIQDSRGTVLRRTFCEPLFELAGAWFKVDGHFVLVHLNQGGFIPRDGFFPYYTLPGCSGEPYLISGMRSWGALWERADWVDQERFYFPSFTGTPVPSELIRSQWSGDECIDFSGWMGFVLAPMDSARFAPFGYKPPFRLK